MSLIEEIEVGKEIEAYCTKCKADSNHVIVAIAEGAPKRVRCNTCDGEHNYRRPKAVVAAEKKAKKPSEKRAPKTPVIVLPDLESWDASLRQAAGSDLKDYAQDGLFQAGQVILHWKFGLGKVEEVLRNKMKVAFREGQKLLICKDKRTLLKA